MVDRRAQFHQSRLGEHIVSANPAVDRWVDYYAQIRMIRGGVTQWMAQQQGFGVARADGRNQSRFYAFMDVYIIYCVLALAALPFVFLMKKSVKQEGLVVD